MTSRRHFLAGALGLTFPASAGAQAPRLPRTAISVLVDLSETWHNDAFAGLNRRLLTSVGSAIVAATPHLLQPIVVRHHGIGAASLGQQPLCSATYWHTMFGRQPAGIYTRADAFARYLADECPRLIISRRAEPLTEITAAIVSALRAMEMDPPRISRQLIVLSDFKEDTPTRHSLNSVDLRGVRATLLYRTLPEDRRNPRGLDLRIADWRQRLGTRGATVQSFDDNAALTPAGLSRIIGGR